jgi:integrase
MVQNRAQKHALVESSKSTAMDKESMPQYMFKSPNGTGYTFRRGVPADVQSSIGKREFKQTLGGDFRRAKRQCQELAVETSRQIEAARQRLGGSLAESIGLGPVPVLRDHPLAEVREVSPDLIARLRFTVIEDVQRAYKQERFSATQPIHPAEKLKEIERVSNMASLAWHGDDTAIRGWTEMLTGTLRRSGFRLSAELVGRQAERELLIEYATAYREALDMVKAAYAGEPPPLASYGASPAAGRLAAEPVKDGGAMALSAAIQDFLTRLLPAQHAMNEKHGFILPAFLEVVGDMPITQLRQKHVTTFLETVQKLPSRWQHIRRKEKIGIAGIAAQPWGETIALATYDGSYRASLHKFIESGKAYWQDAGFPTTLTTAIPYGGSRTKPSQKQRSLVQSEIQKIFLSEEMRKITQSPAQVHKFWLLAVELYTGGRVREICQVNPQHDWGCRNEIWWMKFTEVTGAMQDAEVVKSIKTSKTRIIPIHPELIRIGFLRYLDALKNAGARRLFPKWSPKDGNAGAGPGKWVSNYMRKIGLHGVANENGNAVRGSHTFRHTLLTHGKKNGVNLRCISGHRDSSDNVVADEYEDNTVLLPLSEMAERLGKLDYGVLLPTPVTAHLDKLRQ